MAALVPQPHELDAIRDGLVQTCRQIAPHDFGQQPLYIIFASEMPTETAGDHLYGCTMHSLDLLAMPYLKKWSGRGPALMINDRVIMADILAHKGEAFQCAYWFKQTAEAIGLHEIAHVLERGTQREGSPPAETLAAARAVYFTASQGLDDDAGHVMPAVDFHHGPKWMRIALHLSWRASQLMGTIGYERVIATAPRGLSSAWSYFEALAGEPRLLRGCSFTEILSISAPAAFSALWLEDLARLSVVAV